MPSVSAVSLPLAVLAGGFALAFPASAQVAPPPGPSAAAAGDERLVLNPFVVSETEFAGYSANSTLAGTRINTALRDVGASISIVTPQFLADTGATNAGELLALTTSTEVGGVQGNFAGGTVDNLRPDQSAARESPQNNQRVRGIGPATNTRDFFLTDIPFDAYNTSSVTISRGPNSLLFGIGNPAGIIEASTIRPQLGRNRSEVGTRFGSHDSYRATLDLNRVLERDRIALRLASVSEQTNYEQRPAFDRQRRIFATLEAVLRDGRRSTWLGRTTLRASGELGDSQSTPVNVIPPLNAFGIFFEPPNPAIDDLPGVTLDPRVKRGSPTFMWAPKVTVDNRVPFNSIPQYFNAYYWTPYFTNIPLIYDTAGQSAPGYGGSTNPALTGIAGIMGRMRYPNPPAGRGITNPLSTSKGVAWLPGFVESTLQNRAIFDYRERQLPGGSSRVEKEFQAGNVAFTQELFDGRGGLEVAFDQQRASSSRALPFSFGQNGGANGASAVFIDVSRYLANDEPNPNVGRPFITQLGITDRVQDFEREAFRATVFHRFDLENRGRKFLGVPLGNHTVTGLFSRQRFDSTSRTFQLGWQSGKYNLTTDVFQEELGSAFNRLPVVVQYVGPSTLGAGSVNDVRITEVFQARLPRDGEAHRVTFFDFTRKEVVTDTLSLARYLAAANRSRQSIGSQSLSLKSDFFRDTLVSVVGWRWDRLRTYAGESNLRLPDSTIDFSGTQLRGTPDLDERSHNFTWSLVGRLPKRLSSRLPLGMELGVYYNTSGNFNPIGVRSDLQGAIIPAPAGTTKEYGVLVELFERRASLRLNWFHTEQTDSSNSVQGATALLYGFPEYLANRYRAAQTANVPFSSIRGAAASGYASYDQFYAALFQLLPEPTNRLKQLRFAPSGSVISDAIPGLSDTSNLEARGFEAELVGNLTRRWRLSLNVASQETILTGSARLTQQVAEATLANLTRMRMLGMDEVPATGSNLNIAERFAINVGNPLAATLARDGAVSTEQRKWRANLVSTYEFKGFEHPILSRMSVGGAVRWQQKAAIGMPFLTGQRLKEKIVATNKAYTSTSQIADNEPVMQSQYPDLDHPFYGSDELAGDVWLGYRRRIFRNIDWSLQLNVRNAWGNGDDIPVTANPDGTIAVIRIPNETRWTLGSTFSF